MHISYWCEGPVWAPNDSRGRMSLIRERIDGERAAEELEIQWGIGK
jgi:hypothetical protein